MSAPSPKDGFRMKHGFQNWKQAIALAMVVTALCIVSVPQAGAAESKAMLKPKEVKALVANAKTPADHMKLARHFAAMAEKHEAEAKEHEALAEVYSHRSAARTADPLGTNNEQHCKDYAEHCRRAAADMRAMAEVHEKMAKSLEK